MKKGLKIFIWVVVILSILGIGGCVATLFVANEAVKVVDESIQEVEQKQKDEDALVQAMFDKAVVTENKTDYSFEVVYEVTNDSDTKFDYIEVEYSMYDANGTKLGGSFTNITDIEPGQKFQVKLDLYKEGTVTYKIDNVSSSAW